MQAVLKTKRIELIAASGPPPAMARDGHLITVIDSGLSGDLLPARTASASRTQAAQPAVGAA